jgi:serine/threonine protein phosphatase PrpC
MSGILKRSFFKVNNDIHATNFDTLSSGSTLTTIVTSGNKIICANAGDSRAFLFSIPLTHNLDTAVYKDIKMIELTMEHKPQMAEEKARIERNNGQVRQSIKNGKSVGI